MSGDEHPLKVRLYVSGKLVDECEVDSLEAAAAESDRQGLLALAAAMYDEPWLIEIYNPDAPLDAAYVRFGTDTDGMVDPYEAEVDV